MGRFVELIPKYTLWYNIKSLLLHKDVKFKERKTLLGWYIHASVFLLSFFFPLNICEHLYRVIFTLHMSVQTVLKEVLKGVYTKQVRVRKAGLDKQGVQIVLILPLH